MTPLKDARLTSELLERHFTSKIEVNPDFDRTLVSFQANKRLPEYRWYKYKEGFSAALLFYLFDKLNLDSGKIIDPFAGAGTTLFAASEFGLDSLGIELLPIGCEIVKARLAILNSNKRNLVLRLNRWRDEKLWKHTKLSKSFKHLRITEGAFPKETEKALEQYLALADKETNGLKTILRFAALCILEEISYTRKDGQYLRWDSRAGRSIKKKFNKGPIPSFDISITRKLTEITQDLEREKFDLFPVTSVSKKRGKIELKKGSCLEILPRLPSGSFDGLITSPPYCNRYDYTRTYALELALLGIDEEELRNLRQTMLSCTVENRDKADLNLYFSTEILETVEKIFDSQSVINNIVKYLSKCKEEGLLNNNGLVRMIKNYFWEMSLCIYECARILKPNAPFIMVNDNVRYQGITIPVDLILSDIAKKIGFRIEKIWVLPQGKGNSSQQMGNHGREELRKCVYLWRAPKARLTKQRDRELVLHR